MRVVVIGTGYVGLVSGTCFADFGHHVVCVDKDAAKIDSLNAGRVPIFEPGLDALIAENRLAGRLHFATDPADAIAEADVVFLAVGTPSRRGDGHADLSFVYAAAEEVGRMLRKSALIVTKSTVPVGTGDEIARILAGVVGDLTVDVASNPEFLREGAAIEDFRRPDRIVIGVETPAAEATLRALYRPLYLNKTPIVAFDRRTAELTKYAANAFLATKVAFINEISDLCEAVGANVQDVAQGIGLDNRIGGKFLNAGPGYGGSCFPKDTLALVQTGRDAGVPLSIVESVVAANSARKSGLADRVIEAAGGSVAGKTIALLGLAFKPNTDDMRDAPSLDLVPALQAAGATIRAFDPEAMKNAAQLLSNVEYTRNADECLAGADMAILLTEWNLFRALDLKRMSETLADSTLIDFRNVYTADEAEAAGLKYVSIGRGSKPA